MREIVKRKDFMRLLSPVIMDMTRALSKYHTDTARTKAQGMNRTNAVAVSATLDDDEGPPKLDQGLLLSIFQSTVIINTMSQISATSRRVVQNLAHRKIDWYVFVFCPPFQPPLAAHRQLRFI
jgi:hypothetical protein